MVTGSSCVACPISTRLSSSLIFPSPRPPPPLSLNFFLGLLARGTPRLSASVVLRWGASSSESMTFDTPAKANGDFQVIYGDCLPTGLVFIPPFPPPLCRDIKND